MAYDPRILLNAQFQRSAPPPTLDEIQAAQAKLDALKASTQGTELANEYNQGSMTDRLAEQKAKTLGEGYQARSQGLALPGQEVDARKAGLKSAFYDARGIPALPEALGGPAASVPQQVLPPPYLQRPPEAPQTNPNASGVNLPAYLQRPPEAAPEQAQQAPNGLPPLPPYLANLDKMSLEELRAAKIQDQQFGNLAQEYIDPLIAQKSFREEYTPALNDLAIVQAMPQGSKEEVRLKNAALQGIVAKYPRITADTGFKEAVSTAKTASPDFNPAAFAGVNSRLAGAFLTDWRDARNKYETQYGQPFLQIQGIKNSKSYGTSLGDQSMIDKLIIMETGTKPTEAQYANLSEKIGFGDRFDIFTGKFKSGQQLSAKMRQSLESEIEEQARIGHQAYTENLAQAKEEARLNGLNPDAVIRPGGSFGQVDEHMKRTPISASASGKYSAARIEQAKKYLADPNAPPAYKAKAKEILGIP